MGAAMCRSNCVLKFKMVAGKPCKARPYSDGWRYCRSCVASTKKKVPRCPCCKNPLTTKPRNVHAGKRYDTRLSLDQSIKSKSIQEEKRYSIPEAWNA